MENSSKALLIAAAVLIIILLIAFGVKIFTSSKNSADVARLSSDLKSGNQDGSNAIRDQIGLATGGASYPIDRDSGGFSEMELDPTEGNIVHEDTWDGSSTKTPTIKEFDWYIYTVSQLKFLADFVNNGNTLTDSQKTLVTEEGYAEEDIKIDETVTVYLMNDLNLGATFNSVGEKTSGTEWIPIGIASKPFSGTFDGRNHTIRGVYINEDDIYTGLFGIASVVKNLTIKDSYISGGTLTGGIVGYTRYISNCINNNSIVIQKNGDYCCVGGIAGTVIEEISNCRNTGSIIANGNSSYGARCGGILGDSAGIITSCINEGSITNNGGNHVGGIIGINFGTLSNCYNNGEMIGKNYMGGITGYNNQGIINNCYNKGEINGQDNTGGVLGYNYLGTVSSCYNTGEINGQNNTGGVIGYNNQNSINNCYNTGKITGKNYTGGTIGHNQQGTINNCYNTGEITGQDNTGGVLGDSIQRRNKTML